MTLTNRNYLRRIHSYVGRITHQADDVQLRQKYWHITPDVSSPYQTTDLDGRPLTERPRSVYYSYISHDIMSGGM